MTLASDDIARRQSAHDAFAAKHGESLSLLPLGGVVLVRCPECKALVDFDPNLPDWSDHEMWHAQLGHLGPPADAAANEAAADEFMVAHRDRDGHGRLRVFGDDRGVRSVECGCGETWQRPA